MEKKNFGEIDSEEQLLLEHIVPTAEELTREGWKSLIEQHVLLEKLVLPC